VQGAHSAVKCHIRVSIQHRLLCGDEIIISISDNFFKICSSMGVPGLYFHRAVHGHLTAHSRIPVLVFTSCVIFLCYVFYFSEFYIQYLTDEKLSPS